MGRVRMMQDWYVEEVHSRIQGETSYTTSCAGCNVMGPIAIGCPKGEAADIPFVTDMSMRPDSNGMMLLVEASEPCVRGKDAIKNGETAPGDCRIEIGEPMVVGIIVNFGDAEMK